MSAAQRHVDPVAYRVVDVRFRYAANRRWVLDDLNFDVQTGEILGVIGPNGSGKTTLLKVLAKLLHPQAGQIELFGRGLDALSPQELARWVAVVPQETSVIFPFSIAEVVLMGRFPHRPRGWSIGSFGWEGPADMEVARRAMDDVDVRHLEDRPISEVSGGERQRAIIARALAQQPRVLLLDEPTAFLDLNHQLEICRIVNRLNEERHLTVVLVSHDLNLASQYCDRLMIMSEGKISRIGMPTEVIQADLLHAVYRCEVIVDRHPVSGLPRVTLPGR